MITIKEIAKQLCEGLNKTSDEIQQCQNWLKEYSEANKITLIQLNELCWEDSDWVLNQIF